MRKSFKTKQEWYNGPSFTLRLKTHKVKTLSQKDLMKRFYNQLNQQIIETIHSYQHDFYFSRIMIIPITESNPKIQCQYVLLKVGEYFLWISYDTYCLKVSLSKKLILSQFSQKEITIFLNEKKTQKPKNTKNKKQKT